MRNAINRFIEFFYFDFFKFIPLQTFKYIACGGTTVLVDYLAYRISHHYIFVGMTVTVFSHTFSDIVAASVVSFMISFPLGFALNKYIAFSHSELRGRKQLFRYALTVMSCFVFSIFFIKLFVEVFGFNKDFSKILTIIIVAVYSYFTQQYFSFQVKGKNANTEIE